MTARLANLLQGPSLHFESPRRWPAWILPALALLTLAFGASPAPAQEGEAAAGASTEMETSLEGGSPPPAAAVAIPTTPIEVFRALGWPFVIPFLVASVIAVWFAIERIVVLRRGRVIPRPFVDRFLQHLEQGKLDAETALRLCEENGSPVASVFAHGIRKWGKPSVEVEQAIIDGGERQVSQLRKHLRVLNGVATVTPLVGLLGTVIGMILAFNKIATSSAMGKAEELAVGIALALLTTAAGLMIAIPALIVYMYLSGRVDALVMEMDLLAQTVVQHTSAESLARESIPAPRPRAARGDPPAAAGPQQKRAV